MQFLFPNVLWGLLAVSIPLIIHLFNFRRTKKVYFSNIRLLKNVETSTSSFRKLRQRLLLATRMLFIAALVTAFAQPFIPAKNAKGKLNNTTVTSFYLDNSLSMQNTVDNKSFFDLAVIKTDELLGLFQQLPTIQLLTNDFSPDDQAVTSAARIKERLTTLRYSALPRTFESVLERQKNLIYKFNAQAAAQLFWISDFQRSTAGDLKKIAIDSADHLYLVPVIGPPSQNVYVDSVWLSTPLVQEMQHTVLYAKLHNSGKQAVQQLPIRLYMDEAQTSAATLDIAAGGSAVAKFTFTVRGRGTHKGKIDFDDQPITFDNTYYFTVNASPAVRILHLHQQQAPNQYIQKVFSNDSLFTLNSQSALNADLGQISKADMVVLEGVSQVEGSMKQTLQDFVRKGGSLFVIPSSQSMAASYQSFLGTFGVQQLTLRTEAIQPEQQQPLQAPTRSQPFFADVFEQTMPRGEVNTPQQQPYWSWSGIGVPLLRFRNGQNFLTQTNVQQGKVYVVASPLLPTYGNFAEHALFVPTLYKMAWNSLRGQPPAYQFDAGTIRLKVPEAPKETVYTLKSNELELIPTQRRLGSELLLDLPKATDLDENQRLVSGYYAVQHEGKTLQWLAINHASSESEMDYYSANELREIFRNRDNVTVFDTLTDDNFVDAFAASNFGKPLWKYFIYLALALLAIEQLVIRYWKR